VQHLASHDVFDEHESLHSKREDSEDLPQCDENERIRGVSECLAGESGRLPVVKQFIGKAPAWRGPAEVYVRVNFTRKIAVNVNVIL
jgi:hypothetical protein